MAHPQYWDNLGQQVQRMVNFLPYKSKKKKSKVISLITIFNTVTVIMMALRKKKAEYENSNTIITCNLKFITSHDNVNI